MSARDDATIGDECLLYRWLRCRDVKWDHNLGRHRPTSAAFQNTTDTEEMSIVLGDTLARDGRAPAEIANPYLASLQACCARAMSQVIQRDAIPEEPAHGLVVGDKSRP